MALQSLKDSVVAGLAKRGIGAKITRYGELLSFGINSKEKQITARIHLAGESEPIDVVVTVYHLAEEGDRLHMVVDAATCSREWMNNLIEDFVIGSAFPLPGAAKFALGKPGTKSPVKDPDS